MAISISSVMASLGTGLSTITDLQVYDYPAQNAVAPFALVDFPDSLDYDLSSRRGSDRMTIRVFVGVSNNVDSEVQERLAAYAAASGAGSVKAAIEATGAGSSVRVTRVEFGPLVIGGTTYAGAVFYVDVAA